MPRVVSDDAIRLRFGPHRYPNPFAPGTYFHEAEELANALRGLWSEILIAYARLLRRLPFVD
jgi:hypothetical protein